MTNKKKIIRSTRTITQEEMDEMDLALMPVASPKISLDKSWGTTGNVRFLTTKDSHFIGDDDKCVGCEEFGDICDEDGEKGIHIKLNK